MGKTFNVFQTRRMFTEYFNCSPSIFRIYALDGARLFTIKRRVNDADRLKCNLHFSSFVN